MTDISHTWGGDLAWSPSGDVSLAEGSIEGQQRVLRRILTVAGNYIWQLKYGGGAAALVGTLATPKQVEARMRAQMFMEACVSQIPAPIVKVTQIPTGLNISISYSDAQTADPIFLGFSVT